MLLQDILHMLVGANAVVICKFNPVLDYLGPFAEYAPSNYLPAALRSLLYMCVLVVLCPYLLDVLCPCVLHVLCPCFLGVPCHSSVSLFLDVLCHCKGC